MRGQKPPDSVVIVGGGAAGLTAADTLRREGYDGPVTLISADSDPPYDRPNLSKDYLAGTVPDDWLPLRPPSYYAERRIDLILKCQVVSLDVPQKRIRAADGTTYAFDRLLLATGADPVKLPLPAAAGSQLSYLRTYADSRALAAKVASAKQVVIIGGSFIGLEVAASLRKRGFAVHVVTLEQEPLERVMGHEIGRFIRHLHEPHGVVFHLQDTISRLEGRRAFLRSGQSLDADLLVLGVGVRPACGLAERAGLNVDRGVVVDEYLETSARGIFAAGDIACWPDPRSGERVRVEHWVFAERQGQVAARNLLGSRERFDAVPFFWTRQYDVSIKYVGHAQTWDDAAVDGSLAAMNCAVTFKRGGRALAVATISRDLQSLEAEAAMEASLRADLQGRSG
jgi:NADPH-dependent 2,4-dienoyl-CoA reductase/sulfur reductase-like enzyme